MYTLIKHGINLCIKNSGREKGRSGWLVHSSLWKLSSLGSLREHSSLLKAPLLILCLFSDYSFCVSSMLLPLCSVFEGWCSGHLAPLTGCSFLSEAFQSMPCSLLPSSSPKSISPAKVWHQNLTAPELVCYTWLLTTTNSKNTETGKKNAFVFLQLASAALWIDPYLFCTSAWIFELYDTLL